MRSPLKYVRKIIFALPVLILVGALSKAQAQFAFGVDAGYLAQSEARGVKYYDANGKEGDCLAILKSLGINAIRIRTWVSPANNPNGGQYNKNATIAMAMRCKKLGLRVMLNFHYSDTWSSVGVQTTPDVWENLSFQEHKDALSDYVVDFCKAMRDSGVTPEWFQNGNETNSGVNLPHGALSNPTQMTALFNAGYDAIKSVFPKTKVMIHVAQPQKPNGANMLDAYIKNGGKLDAIGWSSYATAGNVAQLSANVKAWRDQFKMETIMVEIGSAGTPAQNKSLIESWNAANESLNNPCEGGTFYWEAQAYGAPRFYENAIFDATGHPTVAFDAYKTALKKTCALPSSVNPSKATRDPMTFSLNPFTHSVSIRGQGPFTYSLMGLDGRVFASGRAENTVEVGGDLKTGMYLVEIRNAHQSKILKISKY